MVKIGSLEINLIPKPSWGKKIETILGRDVWRAIRRRELKRAGYRCEICSSRQRPLHVHEHWGFDDERGLQILKDLIAVCEKCHLVFHLGYANTQGRLEEAMEHLVRITGMGYEFLYLSRRVFLNSLLLDDSPADTCYLNSFML